MLSSSSLSYDARERVHFSFLTPILLKLPLGVVQRTYLSRFQPSANAVEVEGVIADSPRYCALLTRCATLVSLALDTEVHNMISTDGAVVYDNVPRPKGNSIPLLDLQSLLRS